jgi:uncharacterized membrane protein
MATGREDDMNPLICIQGTASPGHSYPMTPLHVKNTGAFAANTTFAVNPSSAATWLKVSPVRIQAGHSATIPLTLVVPSDAAAGESYVIMTAQGTQFDVRFSVGVPAPRQCIAAGYKAPSSSNYSALLWLVVIVAIVLLVVRYRGRAKRKK